MAIRTLKRKVIIREYDYRRVYKQAFNPAGLKNAIYDRAEFTPLNQDNLEQIKLVEILKGKSGPLADVDIDFSKPRKLLYNLKDFLYDTKYIEWKVVEDEDGFICVQSRSNTPVSRLGLAVFEKDLESRL